METRDIKFRGRRKDNGQFAYGYLFEIWDQAYILWGMTNGVPDMTEVFPDTVTQSTNFTDKNGKEIYGGHVLLLHNTTITNVVIYDIEKGGWMLKFGRSVTYRLTKERALEHEIVGNIY